jgi:DNA-binding NarL/FixJ family response regulator
MKVLSLILENLSNKKISSRLGKVEVTVLSPEKITVPRFTINGDKLALTEYDGPTKTEDITEILRIANALNLGFVLSDAQINNFDLFGLVKESKTLTTSQMKVLSLILENLSNKKISYRLGYTEGTIKSYTNSIFKRLGLRTKTEIQSLFINPPPITLKEIIARSNRVNAATIPVTQKQLRIAELVSEGYKNSEIALALNVSQPIAQKSTANLFEKLGISSRFELIRWYRNYEQYQHLIARQPEARQVPIKSSIPVTYGIVPENLLRRDPVQ